MGVAFVHTDAINQFASSANYVRETAVEIVSIYQEAAEIQNNINGCIRRLQYQLQDCIAAERKIADITNCLQWEYDELNNRYQALLNSEPYPKYEEVTVPAEYDDEGNLISDSYTKYVETDEHKQWEEELYRVGEECNAKYAELCQARSLLNEVQWQTRKLEATVQTLEDIKAKNEAYLNQICNLKRQILDDSEYAVTQLKKAINALKKYLNEYVSVDYPTYSTQKIWNSSEHSTVEKADNSAKQYASPVIVEMDFDLNTRNRGKKTIHIRRQVYQYYEEIDFDYVRKDGRTNRKAMLDGNNPVVIYQGKEDILELHHLIQVENNSDPTSKFPQGGLVEMRSKLHDKYTKTLHIRYPHEKGIRRSFRVTKNADHTYSMSDDEKQFIKFEKQYWKNRVQEHDQKAGK